MDEQDIALRNRTFGLIVELGRPPTAPEVGLPVDEVRAGWRRLHDTHALVLDPAGEIRMANPFSAVATPYRVRAGGRSWYGSCAWDALGICAALDSDGVIETSCPDCGEAITVEVTGRQAEGDLLFHCLVPAAHWWDDIVFT